MRSLFATIGVIGAATVAVTLAWAPGRSHRATESHLSELPQDLPAVDGTLSTLIVDFRDDVTDAVLADNGYVEEPVSRQSRVDRLYRLRFASDALAAQAALALRRDPSVESVDYDVEARLPPGEEMAAVGAGLASECAGDGSDGNATPAVPGFPDDPCFRYQWHMRQIGLPAAWKLGSGKGAVVAVIDTGVTAVPDLGQTHLVAGYNFVNDNETADDDHGHGTHVAGTIAQMTHNARGVSGVAFEAKIMPLKVLSARGSGSMAAIAQAIRFAADHGAQVINMSLGGAFPQAAIRNAVDYAHKHGVTVVAAAGNDGRGKVSYPARYPGVIAVAATQFDESTTFYSNWGKEIDIAAPGGNVRLDDNGDGKPDGVLQNTIVPGSITQTDYLWFMGTSMASPHVAGVAALIVGAGVTRPDAVEGILLSTARASKSGGDRQRFGAGIADAKAALLKARAGVGAGGLALGIAAAGAVILRLRRRQRLGVRIGLGFSATVLAVNVGATGFASLFAGNPLLWSAMPAILAAGLLYGLPRARPLVAGVAFAMAGLLAFGAIAYPNDIWLVPDAFDRVWLGANALICVVLGALVLRR